MRLNLVRLRSTRLVMIGVLATATLAACSSSGSSKASPTTTTLVPLDKDSSTAHLTAGGDDGLAGELSQPLVICSFPRLSGLTVNVSGQLPNPNVKTLVVLRASGVRVRISSGTRNTYHERDFAGAGVTGYDPAKGAHVEATLRDARAPEGTTPGTLGQLTSIKGDVDCGSQHAGSSAVVLAGDTGDGAVSGKLDPVRVACFASAADHVVVASGILQVGTKRVTAFVNAHSAGFNFSFTTASGPTRLFVSNVLATSTTTDHGMHVSGLAVEQTASGDPHTVNVSGDAVCGNAPRE